MRLETAAQLKSLSELVQPHFSNMFLLRPLSYKYRLCFIFKQKKYHYFFRTFFHYEDNVASWKTITYILRETDKILYNGGSPLGAVLSPGGRLWMSGHISDGSDSGRGAPGT